MITIKMNSEAIQKEIAIGTIDKSKADGAIESIESILKRLGSYKTSMKVGDTYIIFIK